MNAFSHRQNQPWIWSNTFNSFLLRNPENHNSRIFDIIDKRQSRVGFDISPPAAPRSSGSSPDCRRLSSKKSNYSSISIACGTHSRAARRTSSWYCSGITSNLTMANSWSSSYSKTSGQSLWQLRSPMHCLLMRTFIESSFGSFGCRVSGPIFEEEAGN
jgi:hypothetical protein